MIKVTGTHDSIRVHVDGMLHLHFYKAELLGIQSWKSGDLNWCVEYTLKDGVTILTEYDSVAKVKSILQQMEKIV